MRFVWAVAAFLLAAVMIGAGIAQRTVFEGPAAESKTVQTEGTNAYTVVDGSVLNSSPGVQTVTAEGSGPVFMAYGRTADVRAWLQDTTFTEVRLGQDALVTGPVEPTMTPEPSEDAEGSSAPAPTETPAASGEQAGEDADTADQGRDIEARDPSGSDLWLEEFQGDETLTTNLQLPEGMSLLIASDGRSPAPASLTFSWPVAVTTPWAGPLIVGGTVVLLAGVLLYILAIRHSRRSRGPRRKGLPLPVTEPIDLAAEADDKGVISASGTRRGGRIRAITSRGRRSFVVVPFALVASLVVTGCSPEAWPQLDDSPSPSPSETIVVPEGQQAPAVTEEQAKAILTRVSETVAAADSALDADLAAQRLSGPALAERETNYTIRKTVADHPAPPAIPSSPVKIVLPQAFDGWPRSVLTVVEGESDSSVAPTIMLLTQDDPWSEYRATYVASLEASTELPDVAASYVGAYQVPPASKFLAIAPENVAAAYADIIDHGQESDTSALFDTQGDLLLAGIQQNRQRRIDEFNQTGDGTGTLTFTATPGEATPLALATLDGGAIVAVNVHEQDSATPTVGGAAIRLNGDTPNPTVQALTGVTESATGFTTTFSDQLFFYVPPQGSSAQVRLLGYRTNILEAKVNP